MKGRYLLFAVCLGCIAFYDAMGVDGADAARAARRGTTSSGVTVSGSGAARQKTASSQTISSGDNGGRTQSATSRNNATTIKNTSTTTPRTIGARTTKTDATRTAGTSDTVNRGTSVTARVGRNTTVLPRATTASRTAVNTVSRSATQARTPTSVSATATPARTATPSRARASTTLARSAASTDIRDAIMGRDYKTCRQVYYDCMDEFCANKDSQLKRCACSSRLHDFDKVKKQLSNVEDKLLDFNQRLLTVSMDKEDAAALFTATEGELAFNQKDTSDSKKILDEISKKLNSDTNSSFGQSLSAISLSLNTDAAFDSVDSLMGASTTLKEGVELYNAALPVCREMAAEVCDDESLGIAESGYQMTIEQDCNTVAKTYDAQTDQAREKIREGSALLDISRLNIYQQRNSDDILTCKKKMLTQLYDTSVCGENLSKCLDMSGRYIDPSTGQAFLTENLAQLATLITRPTGEQSWTTATGNNRFVTYLNSKKKYLEPAMENCQEIADYVWDEFIEDALAQIKLAQDSKLEEIRQSCTTLTTQCLTNASDSISDFDARALSIFGIAADYTANEMCTSVKNACSALLESTGDTGDNSWAGGMTQIATDKTYDTIMQTCREVGRACIIQACKSISGNFGMCEDIQNSINRKSIINRTACWNEVKNCVAEAGEDTINRIFTQVTTDKKDGYDRETFYNELYSITAPYFTNDDETCIQTPGTTNCIFDICTKECNGNQQSTECRTCRLAEKLWGNCEADPDANIEPQDSHNQILPKNSTNNTNTLLAWFAVNTGTQNDSDSCRNTACPSGYYSYKLSDNSFVCRSETERTQGTHEACPTDNVDKISPTGDPNLENCCRIINTSEDKNKDPQSTDETGMISNNKCCLTTLKDTEKAEASGNIEVYYGETYNNIEACTNNRTAHIVATIASLIIDGQTRNNVRVACVSSDSDKITGDDTSDPNYPSGKSIKCNGTFVYIDQDGRYIDPHGTESYMHYYNTNYTDPKKDACQYIKGNWERKQQNKKQCDQDPSGWIISGL